MTKAGRVALGIAVVSLIVAAPALRRVAVARDARNFRAVRDGVLYRSGQMTPAAFARVLDEYGVRTVISLRDSADGAVPPPDEFEEGACASRAVAYHRLSPLKWSAPDGSVPAAKNVARYRELVADPATQYPVLVHCFAGVHRTGAHVAVYRMEADGWSNDDALAEMFAVAGRRAHFEADMLAYLRAYRPAGR